MRSMINVFHKWKYTIMAVLMMLTFAIVINNQEVQAAKTDKLVVDLLESKVEDDYDSCRSRADLRQTLYDLMGAIAEGAVPITALFNFVNIAGFEDLDSPTQIYLANLDAVFDRDLGNADYITSIRDDYLENFPIPDCERERDEAIKELDKELSES